MRRTALALVAAVALAGCAAVGGPGSKGGPSPDQVLAAAEQAYLAAGPAEEAILADPGVAIATKTRILDADAAAYQAIHSAEVAQAQGTLTTQQSVAALAQGAVSGLTMALVDGAAQKAQAAAKPQVPERPPAPTAPLPPPAPLTTPAPIAGPSALPPLAPGGVQK